MNNLQGVIFDMDGLIFDTEPLYYRSTKEIADELSIAYDMDVYRDFIGVGDEVTWATYHEMYDALHGVEVVDEFIKRSYAYAVELFEAGVVDLKPGIRELLAYLDSKNISRVLASSNNRQIIDSLLEKNDLKHEFKEIVSREDVKLAKPDPEIFVKASRFFEAPKEQLLVLEDSEHGVIAAHRAGIEVIMIPDLLEATAELKAKALAVLDSLHDVPAFLEK
ncbi:HAD family hydrolase [Enterococcus olivae]